MRKIIYTLFIGFIGFGSYGQNCNTSGLQDSGSITPNSCDGTFSYYYLADDASDAQLSATIGNEYLITSTTEKYIEIYDGSNNFVTDLYIYMDYYYFTMDTATWSPIVNDTYNLKIYEIYTCVPSGYGFGDLETACKLLPCSYNSTANNLSNYTPDSLGNILNVNMTSGDMIEFNAIEGHIYKFSTCENFDWNTQLYLYNNSNLSIESVNGNCGNTNSQSELYWVATNSGLFKLQLSEFHCINNGIPFSFNLEASSFVPTNTYIVNVNSDGSDSNLNDLICNDGNGNCSLRAAIEQASFRDEQTTILFNINPIDTILVSNGNLNLNCVNAEIDGAIRDSVNILFTNSNRLYVFSDSTTIKNLTFAKTIQTSNSGPCIDIYGEHCKVDSSKIHNSWRGLTLGGFGSGSEGDYCEITNNIFIDNYTQGISYVAENTLIYRNEFMNSGYGAITSNSGYNANSIISENIFKCNDRSAYNNHGSNQVVPTFIHLNNNQIIGKSDPNSLIELYHDDESYCSGSPCQGAILIDTIRTNSNGYWSISNLNLNFTDVLAATVPADSMVFSEE